MALTRKPPAWYWAVVAVLLLWSLMGCFACYTQLAMTPAQLAALPPAQRDAWMAMTLAPKAAYVVGVLAGLAGTLLLAARRPGARAMFVLSLIGVTIQFGWFFLVWGGMAKVGPGSVGFPLLIFLVCLGEIWFSGFAARQGWTR